MRDYFEDKIWLWIYKIASYRLSLKADEYIEEYRKKKEMLMTERSALEAWLDAAPPDKAEQEIYVKYVNFLTLQLTTLNTLYYRLIAFQKGLAKKEYFCCWVQTRIIGNYRRIEGYDIIERYIFKKAIEDELSRNKVKKEYN